MLVSQPSERFASPDNPSVCMASRVRDSGRFVKRHYQNIGTARKKKDES
jgi:hypothetical protein